MWLIPLYGLLGEKEFAGGQGGFIIGNEKVVHVVLTKVQPQEP